jgi:uncharacterized membrane protein
MALPWHLYVMAGIYILAGLNHFRVPRFYERIIPDYLPAHKILNYLSGLAEVILGILLCIPETSQYAAWGIIALLIAIFPANVYMYTNNKAALGLPKWVRLARLPIQLVLILWAYLYTQEI